MKKGTQFPSKSRLVASSAGHAILRSPPRSPPPLTCAPSPSSVLPLLLVSSRSLSPALDRKRLLTGFGGGLGQGFWEMWYAPTTDEAAFVAVEAVCGERRGRGGQ